MNRSMTRDLARACVAIASVVGLLHVTLDAQDRLKSMPGYAALREDVARDPLRGEVRRVDCDLDWSRIRSSTRATASDTATTSQHEQPPRSRRRGRGFIGSRRSGGGPARGRQFDSSVSPDGKLKAFYRDRNLWLSDGRRQRDRHHHRRQRDKHASSTARRAGSTAKSCRRRPRCGGRPTAASSPTTGSTRRRCPTITCRSTRPRSRHGRHRGVSEGRRAESRSSICSSTTSPSKKSTRIDVRDGKPFDNAVVGHYVYRVAWSPDGTELLFNRTNRRQNILEFAAANPATGTTRVVVREEWPTGWIENNPAMLFLEGRQALHLGIGAQRLEQLLSLRSRAAS